MLNANDITMVVDVRAVPKSRYHPWFNRAHFEQSLPMKYLWRGDVLGGKSRSAASSEQIQTAIDELAVLSAVERVCILCSERDAGPSRWKKAGCHRWHTIAPALHAKGVEVIHL